MTQKIFRWSFLAFLVAIALVAGGACYQTVSINPFWQNDISMFRNYRHWGINYFPFLSPLMTVLWIIVVISGFKLKYPGKSTLYAAHFLFLLITISTFGYFAPFLLTYMGQPQINISDQELTSMLNTWVKWDRIRQIIGVITLSIFIYCYGRIQSGSKFIAGNIPSPDLSN